MRKLLFLALLTVSMQAEPLPPGGKDVAMPGFSFHTPGVSWQMRDPVDSTNKDGSSFEGRMPGFNLHMRAVPAAGEQSSVYVSVTATVLAARDADLVKMLALVKYLEEKDAAAPSVRNRAIKYTVRETAVNGALCIRTDMTSEDIGVPGHQGEPYALAVHSIKCPHPDFPSYVVGVEYSTRVPPGGALFVPETDGEAVLASLKLTPLAYRVSQIRLGELPQMMAEGFGAVWAAWGGPNGKVTRINTATNKVEATIPVGRLPIGVAADANGIWVANRDDNTVMQINPATNKVERVLPVSGGPQLMAAGAGAIWVASLNGPVWRIDSVSGAITRIDGAGDQLAGIAVVNGQVYVADYQNDALVRIDPATNKVAGRIKAARFASHLVADGSHIWVSVQEARAQRCFLLCDPEASSPVKRSKKTAVLDIDTAAPEAQPRRYDINIGNMPRGAAMWRGKFWVANWTGATLSVVEPGQPAASYFPIGVEPVAVLAAGGALWVTVGGITDSVLRIDPK